MLMRSIPWLIILNWFYCVIGHVVVFSPQLIHHVSRCSGIFINCDLKRQRKVKWEVTMKSNEHIMNIVDKCVCVRANIMQLNSRKKCANFMLKRNMCNFFFFAPSTTWHSHCLNAWIESVITRINLYWILLDWICIPILFSAFVRKESECLVAEFNQQIDFI